MRKDSGCSGFGHVLITGGSSGIGQALAVRMAGRGACISIIARDPARLETARTKIAAAAGDPAQRVIALSADVADPCQAARAVDRAIGELGSPDTVVTCAGMARPGHFAQLPLDVFERTMAVNFFGTLYTIRAALPAMAARRRGRLVLVSSGAGLVGLYGYTAYSSSKFALRGLAESLRAELKPVGIGVAIVYPPDTDTAQLAAENKTKPAETKAVTGTVRTWSADAVARAILRGLDRNAFAITPGLAMGLLYRLHSLLNPLIHRYTDALGKRVGQRSLL